MAEPFKYATVEAQMTGNTFQKRFELADIVKTISPTPN